jgi:site-specific DNA-methyltransferase (adenine-specific)
MSDDVRLIEGDSLAVLPTLESGSVDAVITDPPYGSVTHAGARGARPGPGFVTAPLVPFASIDVPAFLGLCRELVRVARRWVMMTCDWRHAAAAEEAGLPVVRVGVWVKPDAAPQFTGDRPGTGWEAVLLLHRPGRKRWNGGGHHAVWTHRVERNASHPTQKPLALVREWVRLFTDPGETILDPFAGSGTTGTAALAEGRRAVLIERDPAHCETIRRRLARFDGPLFSAAAPVTKSLFPEESPCAWG